jgi:head-tail adaptor
MTVSVAKAHAHVQRLVSIAKMATVLEDCTTEEQRSTVRFCGQKDSMQAIFINKGLLFMLESTSMYRVKRFHLGGKRSADDEGVKTEVRKWLRQQSNFCQTSVLQVSTHL